MDDPIILMRNYRLDFIILILSHLQWKTLVHKFTYFQILVKGQKKTFVLLKIVFVNISVLKLFGVKNIFLIIKNNHFLIYVILLNKC